MRYKLSFSCGKGLYKKVTHWGRVRLLTLNKRTRPQCVTPSCRPLTGIGRGYRRLLFHSEVIFYAGHEDIHIKGLREIPECARCQRLILHVLLGEGAQEYNRDEKVLAESLRFSTALEPA